MFSSKTLFAAAAVAGTCIGVSSCVDHDYDLADDIDMTVQVGGDITIPASNTDILTLSEILDLDPTSSIIEIGADGNPESYGLSTGDYALVQDGNSEPANFSVDRVNISGMGSTVRTSLPQFVGTGAAEVVVGANPTINVVDLKDDNVPLELRRLDAATMSIDMNFMIGFESNTFHGTATIKAGYTAEFDRNWTLEIPSSSAAFLELVNAYTVRFKTDYPITASRPMRATVRLTKVNFAGYSDMGLVAPGHFVLVSDVHSHGSVAIGDGQLGYGQTAELTMVTTTSVEAGAQITTATGLVAPEINIKDTPFTISDIPDFLSDDANNLHVDNPRILFTVDNNSPLTLQVRGLLNAFKDGVSTLTSPIEIGYQNHIIVPPTATTTFVICSHNEPANPWFEGKTVIEVPNLADVLRTIPDEIEFEDVECEAVQSPVTFTLGHNYTFNADYNAIIPLAFGADMRLHYTHEDTDWDSDDLKDYNFNEAHITANIVNALPLTMTPAVEGLDRQLNTLSNVTATITAADGSAAKVAAGTPGAPTTTPVKIVLRSTGSNLRDLDGVRIIFDAYDPIVGTNLNSAQSLRFEDIKIQIKGGVTVNLND